MTEHIDAIFISHYTDIDRWHNDPADFEIPSVARTRGLLAALTAEPWMKDEADIVIDGRLYDFSRFLSWIRYGTTSEHARFDPFNLTMLSGTYFLNLLSGFDVRVLNEANRLVISSQAAAYSPRFVLLSTTLMFDAVERDVIPNAVAQIRRAWPDAAIVLGGLLLVSSKNLLSPTKFGELLLRYGADAYVVSARGEAAITAILNRGSKQSLLSGNPIVNTYLISNGTILQPAEGIEPELEISKGYIRWNSLRQTDHLYHTVHTRTARSCAFNCSFCEYPINQGPLTLMPLDAFDAELKELRMLKRVHSLIFTDDTFNVPLPRFKELLRILAKYEFQWYSFFRPQYTDSDTASLMKASGCRAVFAGIESVDEVVLRNMNKKAKPDDYKRGIDLLHAQGISVHANFIVGFPGDTETAAWKTVNFVADTGLNFTTMCTWVYLPSTPIEAKRDKFGISGFGMNWRHNSMNSDQASEIARAIAYEQKYAVHNAVRGEAWSEFLLLSNGLSIEEIKLAISLFNKCLGRDVSKDEIVTSKQYEVLQTALQKYYFPTPVT